MNKPFILKPIFKDYIWGGQRIITDLHKNIDINPCAEAWEFSCHPNGVSFVDSGEYKGKQINEVFKMHPEFLGKYSNKNGDSPILIKFIDAKEDLSVQVHPNDAYAKENENSLGKTEVWYILDSKDGHLSIGFKEDTNKKDVEELLNNGEICNYMNNYAALKGEYYPIEAGTIHSIGKGCLLIEVQENSDLTYRLYDFDRKNADGSKRELHISKGLDVLNYQKYNKPNQNEVDYSCKYFKMNVISSPCKISTNNDDFNVLICIEGSSTIILDDEKLLLNYGQSLFVPANSDFKIDGNCKLLKVEV